MRKTRGILLQLILILELSGYGQDLKEMEQKQLKTPQGNWSYATSSHGRKALLFIHGASSSKKIWKNQYGLALEGYKNIFVDLLGYGASDKPESGYTLADWLEGLHQILLQEQIDELVIVAHSNGVIFAKEYYRAYPDQVTRLLLLDGMLKPMIDERMLGWMRSALERPDYEAFMENNIKFMPVAGLSEADAELLRTDGLSTPKCVTKGELALVSDPDTWKKLVIQCPVIIIHSNNPTWDEAYIDWLPGIAPHHQLIEWKDAGHFIPLQYPGRLNDLIREAVLGE